MSEQIQEGFKPINTQEELDKIITSRLARDREATAKRYEGWVSPEDHQSAIDNANKALEDYKKAHEGDEKTIADLTAKNKAYETAATKSRIAHEVGLSFEWLDRIKGDDEKSIREDAESLKKLVGAGTNNLMPTKNSEAGGDFDKSNAALRSVLNGIKNN
jgi:hypothetical protein